LYKLKLVLRYLRKRKITVFPIAGVAVGVMALVVVLAIMDGFDTDFRRSIRGILPDMSLQFRYLQGYEGNVDDLVKRIEAVPQVRAASPYVSGLALVDVRMPEIDFGGNVVESVTSEYVSFRGFDWEKENRVLNLEPHLRYGEGFSPQQKAAGGEVNAAFVVGSRLAGRKFPGIRTKTPDWGKIDRGAPVQVLTFTSSYERSRVKGAVADIVSTGVYDIDAHTLFMPIDTARRLREVKPNSVSGIGIALREYNPANVEAARLNIENALSDLVPPIPPGGYGINTWEQERGPLLAAVAMERRIMAFILFFFLVVAGFAISAILIMIVLEKIRDIGILLAMGASSKGIAATFLIYGVTIGLIGAGIGLAAGVLFVHKIDFVEQVVYERTGWQPFPPEIYDLPAIPRILDWHTNLYIVATAVAVSFLASLLPAVRAAWLDPVEAIRYE